MLRSTRKTILATNFLLSVMCLIAGTSFISAPAFAQQDDVDGDVDVKPKTKDHGHMGMKRKHRRSHHGAMRERLKMVDDNGDGKVDLTEYLSHAEARFNEMDLNSDQFVTPEEAKEAHKSMRAKHREERKKLHKERKRLYKQNADNAAESDQG